MQYSKSCQGATSCSHRDYTQGVTRFQMWTAFVTERLQPWTRSRRMQNPNIPSRKFLLPMSQTLFYFTEDEIKEPALPKKNALIFLRSCDLHAVRRLDEIYLNNGAPDAYYSRLRERCRFVLIGCPQAFSSCFCVDMGTNIAESWERRVRKERRRLFHDRRIAGDHRRLEKACR